MDIQQADKSGKIVADKISKAFPINRGSKQGDPISPTLFNAVLEMVMRKLKPQWLEKGFGVDFGEAGSDVDTHLQNLRFADDVLLVGASLEQVTEMLEGLQREAKAVGLQLHMGKTKILAGLQDPDGQAPANRSR